ncbi:hypothetical protein B0H67DRAFT_591250 [Lasiosphaeris hirsuta]|uniref:Uncharacterized protein n=1 Tax=Lasiosphaeris hirsuta TaxID=260670 RepID=A0AA40DIF4_9PEZI|nr:hypothetical protein B0H67DRAFT_591250 [Lasiosphaeris hirsuta]
MVSLPLFSLGRAVALLSTLTRVLPSAAASIPPNTPNPASLLQARAIAWQARSGMTTAQYQTTFDNFVSSGYRLTCVAGYTSNNDPRFAAIWDKSLPGVPWVSRSGMTSAQYQSNFDTYVSQGYRPKHVYGYAVGNAPYFAAIWDKSPAPGNGAWAARHGLTSDQYQTVSNTFTSQGYTPVHVSGYAENGQARYAALWEKPSGGYPWLSRHGLTSAQYQQAASTWTAQGYRPVKVNGYVVGGVDYYTTIWDKAPSPPWVTRHGLTAGQYQAEYDRLVPQGYRATVVSAYTLYGNQDRYAAIWVKE